MNDLSGVEVDQEVVQMPVPEADDVADDGHDGDRPDETLRQLQPVLRVDRGEPDFLGQEVVGRLRLELGQNLPHDRQRPLSAVVEVGDALVII